MNSSRTNTAVWIESAQRWQINVQKDGKRKTFVSSKVGRTGQREANKKADEWLRYGLSLSSVKVKELYQRYLQTVEIEASEQHYRRVKGRYQNWVSPILDNIKIANLTEQDLQDVIDNAYKSKKLAKKTLMHISSDLQCFCRFCRKAKYTSLNPEDLKIPSGAKRPREKRILQPSDFVKLMSIDTTILYGKVKEEPYINAYRFEVLTGLRPSELAGLQWEDWDGIHLRVRRGLIASGEVTQGKSEHAIRTVILSESAQDILKSMKKGNPTDSIFDIGMYQTYISRWHRYCQSNGLTDVTLYELRHTFISICQKLPESEVKRLVGHSKNMDTFGVYGHVVDGQDEELSATLQNIFFDIEQKGRNKKACTNACTEGNKTV